jgi:H+/Cl- antiporter ClcA
MLGLRVFAQTVRRTEERVAMNLGHDDSAQWRIPRFLRTWSRRILNWSGRLFSDYTNIQALGLWTSAVLTGLVSVGYAMAFRGVEFLFEHLLTAYGPWFMAVTPFAFLLAWFLVYRFAPDAGGSGIPQVMAAVELAPDPEGAERVHRLLSLRTAAVKIISSLLCLFGGGAIGREGPTLQVSAAIFHYFGKHVQRYYEKFDERTWIIAGSAAGLASAFNTPLGGIVYGIEELAAAHFHRIKIALLTSVIISGLVAQSILGSYLYLGYPRLLPLGISAWPVAILIGIVSGSSGAAFSRLLLAGVAFRRRLKSPFYLALIPLVCGLAVAGLGFFETKAYGPGNKVISDILFSAEPANITLVIHRILSTSFAYLSGSAGGVFSPSLAIGATIGSSLADMVGSPNINLMAMIGMIGFLTGLTHSPFTSFILVVEMSDRHSAVFPMMIGALVANGAAVAMQRHSFYERVKLQILRKPTSV